MCGEKFPKITFARSPVPRGLMTVLSIFEWNKFCCQVSIEHNFSTDSLRWGRKSVVEKLAWGRTNVTAQITSISYSNPSRFWSLWLNRHSQHIHEIRDGVLGTGCFCLFIPRRSSRPNRPWTSWESVIWREFGAIRFEISDAFQEIRPIMYHFSVFRDTLVGFFHTFPGVDFFGEILIQSGHRMAVNKIFGKNHIHPELRHDPYRICVEFQD